MSVNLYIWFELILLSRYSTRQIRIAQWGYQKLSVNVVPFSIYFLFLTVAPSPTLCAVDTVGNVVCIGQRQRCDNLGFRRHVSAVNGEFLNPQFESGIGISTFDDLRYNPRQNQRLITINAHLTRYTMCSRKFWWVVSLVSNLQKLDPERQIPSKSSSQQKSMAIVYGRV